MKFPPLNTIMGSIAGVWVLWFIAPLIDVFHNGWIHRIFSFTFFTLPFTIGAYWLGDLIGRYIHRVFFKKIKFKHTEK